LKQKINYKIYLLERHKIQCVFLAVKIPIKNCLLSFKKCRGKTSPLTTGFYFLLFLFSLFFFNAIWDLSYCPLLQPNRKEPKHKDAIFFFLFSSNRIYFLADANKIAFENIFFCCVSVFRVEIRPTILKSN
jgi:hypothetical protein